MHAKMDGLILVQVLLLLQSHLLTQGRSTHGHFVPTMASDLFASRRNAPGQHLANHVTRSERALRIANNKFESQVTHELKRNANANLPFLKGFFDHDSMRNGQHFLAELIYGNHRSQGHGGDLIDQHKQRNDRLQGVVKKTPVQLARASFRRPSGRIWNAGKYDHHAFSDNLSPTELTHDGEHDLDAISDNLSPTELTHDGTHDLHASDNLSPTELTHDGTHDLDAFSDNLSPIELTHDGTHDLHASDNLSPTNAKQDAIGWKSQLASSKEDSEVFSDPGTPLTGEDSDTAQTDSSHTNGEHFMAHSDQVAQVDLVSDVKEESSLQASLQEDLPDAFERKESTQLDDNVKEDLPDAFKREESTQFGDNVNKEIDQNLIDQNILLSSSSEQALQGNILPGQNVKELYNVEEAHGDHKNTEFSSPDDATSQQNSLSPASVVTNTFADNQVKLASSVVSSGSEELHEVLADEQLFGSFKEATESSLTSSEDVKSEVSESDAVKSEVSESDAVKSEVSESDAVKSEVSESDAVKSEVSESDAVKSEVSESDAVKSEVSESDAVKSEVSESDAVKSEVSESDAVKSEVSESDAVKSEVSESDAVKSEVSESDAVKSEVSESDAVKSEVSESDAVKSEVSESDAVKSEVSESDAVKSEVSESDAVKSEVSESDAVKSEVSESDAVKSEVSESDAMKSEVSKSDAVKSGLSRRDVMTNAHVQADLKGRRL